MKLDGSLAVESPETTLLSWLQQGRVGVGAKSKTFSGKTGCILSHEWPQILEILWGNMPTTEKPRQCGARTDYGPCKLPPAPGSKRRCELHSGGAPTGNRNGQFKHGRFSRTIRAQRTAEINERGREWADSQPKIDYVQICAQLALLKKMVGDDG